MIRVREKPAHEHHGDNHFVHDVLLESTYYFYVKHELDENGKTQVQMIEDIDQIVGFTINDEFIFIWSKK